MPRGRPKGALNRSTLAKLNQTTTANIASTSIPSTSTPVSSLSTTALPTSAPTPTPTSAIPSPTPSPKSQKKLDNLPKCTCCNTPITCTPYRLNLTYLSGGIAPYHRNLKVDTPVLCDKCAKGLNKVIEDYLLKMGAEKKF